MGFRFRIRLPKIRIRFPKFHGKFRISKRIRIFRHRVRFPRFHVRFKFRFPKFHGRIRIKPSKIFHTVRRATSKPFRVLHKIVPIRGKIKIKPIKFVRRSIIGGGKKVVRVTKRVVKRIIPKWLRRPHIGKFLNRAIFRPIGKIGTGLGKFIRSFARNTGKTIGGFLQGFFKSSGLWGLIIIIIIVYIVLKIFNRPKTVYTVPSINTLRLARN